MTLERRATTFRRAPVTVETSDHTEVADTRYKLHFFDFEEARKWIQKILRRYESNDKRIRLIAWRGWENGPDGREVLGRYESKTTC